MHPYVSEFGEILLYLIGGLLFCMAVLFSSRILRPNRPNPEKLAIYESGEEPVSTPWTQFNMRFYVVALIFLLFEVEIVFLFPWATVFAKKEFIDQTNGTWGWFSLVEMLIFIGVLAIGLAYAWVNGHLDWVKPEHGPRNVDSPVPADLYKAINDKYRSKSASAKATQVNDQTT